MNNMETKRVPATQRESFTELLGQLASNSSTMVHDEIELVIQGIREKERDVRSAALTVATGAVIIFVGFIFFFAALFIRLTSYMPPVIAALITGAILALTGIIIL